MQPVRQPAVVATAAVLGAVFGYVIAAAHFLRKPPGSASHAAGASDGGGHASGVADGASDGGGSTNGADAVRSPVYIALASNLHGMPAGPFADRRAAER